MCVCVSLCVCERECACDNKERKKEIMFQHTLCSVHLDNHCMFLYFTLACKYTVVKMKGE